MLADDFALIFRDEHRVVRDTLLDLIQAFEDRDREWIRALLNGVARFTGPHFRYEEESMYPALTGLDLLTWAKTARKRPALAATATGRHGAPLHL